VAVIMILRAQVVTPMCSGCASDYMHTVLGGRSNLKPAFCESFWMGTYPKIRESLMAYDGMEGRVPRHPKRSSQRNFITSCACSILLREPFRGRQQRPIPTKASSGLSDGCGGPVTFMLAAKVIASFLLCVFAVSDA